MLQNGSLSWILISRGPKRNVDEAWQQLEEPPQDVEMVSSASVEQSFAMTTSIEESNAQSSILMNPPSKAFIPTDHGKWIDSPAVNNVKRESLAWKISKKVRCFHDVENFIERLTEQFIKVFCYHCDDVTSNTKVLEPSQILNGGVNKTHISVLCRLEHQSLAYSGHPRSLGRRSD